MARRLARETVCAIFNVVQGRSHSISDHAAFRLALFAFACVLMVLISGGSPARLAGADWLTRQIDDRVEQIEAPMVSLDLLSVESLPEEVAEVTESTDDDETERRHLPLEVALRFDLAVLESQTGLSESSAARALTPFRLRAFSTRGSPSA